jgi:hypothetical protein
LHRVFRESIRLRPEVADKVAGFHATRFGRHVLGVHIRGQERAKERLFFAPHGLVPFERYVQEIDAYLRTHRASSIFCATDSQDALDALEARYGARLIYYPATRLSPRQEHLGLHYADWGPDGRAGIGEQVVIDCHLLSKCDHLVHGSSNVSLTARLIEPTLSHLDVYRKYGYTLPKLRGAYVRYRLGSLAYRADRLFGPRWRVPLRYVKRRLLRG